jgi:hypothetical protein
LFSLRAGKVSSMGFMFRPEGFSEVVVTMKQEFGPPA